LSDTNTGHLYNNFIIEHILGYGIGCDIHVWDAFPTWSLTPHPNSKEGEWGRRCESNSASVRQDRAAQLRIWNFTSPYNRH